MKRTLHPKRINGHGELEIGALLYPPREYDRPRTRGDCADVPRPCPFVSCRHNNYLDVTERGSIRLAFPHLEPWDVDPAISCSLDVADEGEHLPAVVGKAIGVTRERVRQIIAIHRQEHAGAWSDDVLRYDPPGGERRYFLPPSLVSFAVP